MQRTARGARAVDPGGWQGQRQPSGDPVQPGFPPASDVQCGNSNACLSPLQSGTGGSDGKDSACNEGDRGSSPGSGRSPGEGHGNPLQYSCLENFMGRGAWWAAGVCKESDTTEQLAHTHKEVAVAVRGSAEAEITGCRALSLCSSEQKSNDADHSGDSAAPALGDPRQEGTGRWTQLEDDTECV